MSRHCPIDYSYLIASCQFCEVYGEHRDRHGLTHSVPTRRAAELGLGKPTLMLNSAVDDCSGVVYHEYRSVYGEDAERSEEHTSELQSLMRTSCAGFCLKIKTY